MAEEKGRVSRPFLVSGRQDLNLRPPGPQPGALPDCATPRGKQAGDGNRTRPRSLEGFCATTTLRPHDQGLASSPLILPAPPRRAADSPAADLDPPARLTGAPRWAPS